MPHKRRSGHRLPEANRYTATNVSTHLRNGCSGGSSFCRLPSWLGPAATAPTNGQCCCHTKVVERAQCAQDTCMHGSERLVELHRDPERMHKLDVAARRKQDRAAIRIVAVLKGHMVRSRLRGDCDGADAFADPGRHERIQNARFSKTTRRTRLTLPPNTIEDLAAALIASVMKGHLVRRRIREGHVARFVDPNRDRLIGAARALRRSGYTPRTMATVGAHTDWTVRAHTQSTSGLHNDEWFGCERSAVSTGSQGCAIRDSRTNDPLWQAQMPTPS